MPSLLDFRRRIRSVKNTQQITRAMKFTAARLRRAQKAALAAAIYANELARLLRSIMVRIGNRNIRWRSARTHSGHRLHR
jgi:F-type H+-transporting ATPase subunit gamma